MLGEIMKVGDLVRLDGSLGQSGAVGVLLGPWTNMSGWCSIMMSDGIVHWPEDQLSLV